MDTPVNDLSGMSEEEKRQFESAPTLSARPTPLAMDSSLSGAGSPSGKIKIAIAFAIGVAIGGGTCEALKDRQADCKDKKEADSPTLLTSSPVTTTSGDSRPRYIVPLNEAEDQNPPGESNTWIPKSPEQLKSALKEAGIMAKDENFTGTSKGSYFSSVMMASEGDGIKWKPFDQSLMSGNDTLLALKMTKTDYKYLLHFSGRKPLATYSEGDIVHVYYRCVDSDNNQNRAAAIAVLDPKTVSAPSSRGQKQPHSFLAILDFTLPKCVSGTSQE